MKGVSITDIGLEEASSIELKDYGINKCETYEGITVFEIKDEEELARVTYKTQISKRILKYADRIEISADLEKSAEKISQAIIKYPELKNKKIKLECERNGEHDFNSVDLVTETSELLRLEEYKTGSKEYDLQIYIYIYKNNATIGIDFSGRDLSKRDYRVFTTASSIKGSLACALLKLSGYKPGEKILDPYCESGVIPIEAAIYASKKSVNYYKKEFEFLKINSELSNIFEEEDSKEKKKIKEIYCYDKNLKNINSSKKNAKIAGMDKNINFSKTDIEWLDTKFDKETVDKVITKIPSESKRQGEKIITKLYEELFYQIDYILKKKGVAIICVMKDELAKKIAEKKHLKLKRETSFYSGKQEYKVLIFNK